MPKLSIRESMAKLIFPVHCLGCQIEGDWICADCQRHLQVTPPELCRICGKYGPTGICGPCQEKTGLDGIISLFRYSQKPIQDLIKAIKYQRYRDGLGFLARQYRLRLLKQLPEGDWVFSAVPLSRQRHSERGFNQAETLARLLAGEQFSYQPLFKKLASTPAQASLERSERLKNLRNVFNLTTAPPAQLIIGDDVVTTGTTLGQLAKLSKKRGAKEVWAITIAHG